MHVSADCATIHIVLELPLDSGKSSRLMSLLIDLGVDNLKVMDGGAVDFDLDGKAAECFDKWRQISTFGDES